MNRVVIIEDEHFAAEHLSNLISKLRPEIEICAQIATVEFGIEWFKSHKDYDLIFSDIQLADGICFDIFKAVKISAPIIFTTAYDQYAIQAFKHNSIDYLLKPIDKKLLDNAFKKFEKLQKSSTSIIDSRQIQELFQSIRGPHKKRFSVKIGDHLKLVSIDEILYFESQHKITYLITIEGRRYPVQYTLQEIETMIDPDAFYRINRQMIISDRSIQDVVSISNSRLKIKIPFSKDSKIVSRERCASFKDWLDR